MDFTNHEKYVINTIQKKIRSVNNQIVYKNGSYSADLTREKKLRLARSLYLFISRNIIIFKSFKYKKFIITMCRKSNEFANYIDTILLTESLNNHYKWYLSCCKNNFIKVPNQLCTYFKQLNLVLNRLFCNDISYYIKTYL